MRKMSRPRLSALRLLIPRPGVGFRQIEDGDLEEIQPQRHEPEDEHPDGAGIDEIAQNGARHEEELVDAVQDEVQVGAEIAHLAPGPGQHPVGAVDDGG